MHMRFVAFVAFAVDRNISQILLPSLRWGDPYNKSLSIEHELLFDVSYWNERAKSVGLPYLVDYDPNVLEGIVPTNRNNDEASSTAEAAVLPCWNETSGLFSGVNETLVRNPDTNLRKLNAWNLIGQEPPYLHCRRYLGDKPQNDPADIAKEAKRDIDNHSTKVFRYTHLVPHGGLMSSGRLWWEYDFLQRNREKASVPNLVDGELVYMHPEHVPVEKAIYNLLRPSRYLEEAMETAIDEAMQKYTMAKNDHLTKYSNSQQQQQQQKRPRLLALHPRIEQVMLRHHCNKHMESNFTKILEFMESYPPFHEKSNNNSSSSNSSSTRSYKFDLVFLAVSAKDVEFETHNNDHVKHVMAAYRPMVDHNRGALRHARKNGLFYYKKDIGIPIFESGTESAEKIRFPRFSWYLDHPTIGGNASYVTAREMGVLELVASIINFFTAIRADIFVGVRGSTYSTDAFSVRYYQRKEEEEERGRSESSVENFIVGPQGIERLYGPAAPLACK